MTSVRFSLLGNRAFDFDSGARALRGSGLLHDRGDAGNAHMFTQNAPYFANGLWVFLHAVVRSHDLFADNTL